MPRGVHYALKKAMDFHGEIQYAPKLQVRLRVCFLIVEST